MKQYIFCVFKKSKIEYRVTFMSICIEKKRPTELSFTRKITVIDCTTHMKNQNESQFLIWATQCQK